MTASLSSALVCSTRPRVSVSVRATPWLMLSGFSRKHAYRRCPPGRSLAVLSGSPKGADLPAPPKATPFNGLFRQPAAVSLLRPRVAHGAGNGILTVSWRFPASIIVTYACICFSRSSSRGRPRHSPPLECSPTDPLRDPAASAPDLCPIIIHAPPLDQ